MYDIVCICSNATFVGCVQAEEKLVMKTWSDLYINFVRLSAMVANTEPNIACEQLMSRVYSFTKPLTTDVCVSVCLSVSLICSVAIVFLVLYISCSWAKVHF